MKNFDPRDGWLYMCVGGPADGMPLRMSANQRLQADEQPVEAFTMSNHPDGHYWLTVVPDRFARGRIPWLEYRWVEVPLGADIPDSHFVDATEGVSLNQEVKS